jgi:cell volume regulation protein A
MSAVSLFLITIAGIFLIGVIGEVVFERTGIPDVVWLILVGIVLGPMSGLVDRSQLTGIAPYFGAITLVIVLFDGGSGLRLKELTHAAPRATVLALVGFVLSAGTVAAASVGAARLGMLPDSWGWLHGIMLGSILGGSSSVVIMPALAKAKLDASISNLVNLESALTDVLCVVVTDATVRIAVAGTTDAVGAAATLGQAFAVGLGIGVTAGLLALLALRALRGSSHAYPLILGALLIVYVLIDHVGGSAPLGILAMAVLVGNAPSLSKAVGLARSVRLSRGVEHAHDQITFIVKSFFFVFIGAMLGPPWPLVALGAALGVILLGARIPAVFGATAGASMKGAERGLVTVSMPRGMAAGVLALLPTQAGIEGTEQLPVVAFASVFMTILVFAGGFPLFKRRLAPPGASARAEPKEQVAPSGTDPPSCTEGSGPTADPSPIDSAVSREGERE